MSHSWRIRVQRSSPAGTVHFFNPPDRMYTGRTYYGAFSVQGGSYMLDAPEGQTPKNFNLDKRVRLRFDRVMHIKKIYVHGYGTNAYRLRVYDEEWSSFDEDKYINAHPYEFTTPVYVKNLELYFPNAVSTTKIQVGFDVLNYVPSTLLINNTHEIQFSELDFEAVVPTHGKDLMVQMVSGPNGTNTEVSASLIS